jgi:hypothetical protein
VRRGHARYSHGGAPVGTGVDRTEVDGTRFTMPVGVHVCKTGLGLAAARQI